LGCAPLTGPRNRIAGTAEANGLCVKGPGPAPEKKIAHRSPCDRSSFVEARRVNKHSRLVSDAGQSLVPQGLVLPHVPPAAASHPIVGAGSGQSARARTTTLKGDLQICSQADAGGGVRQGFRILFGTGRRGAGGLSPNEAGWERALQSNPGVIGRAALLRPPHHRGEGKGRKKNLLDGEALRGRGRQGCEFARGTSTCSISIF